MAAHLPRPTGAVGQVKRPALLTAPAPGFGRARGELCVCARGLREGPAGGSPRSGEGSPRRAGGGGSGGRRRGAAPSCGGRRTAGPGGGAAAEAPGRAAERAGGGRAPQAARGAGARRSGASVRRRPAGPLRSVRRGLVPPLRSDGRRRAPLGRRGQGSGGGGRRRRRRRRRPGAGWVPPREDEAEARAAERAELGLFPPSRQDKMAAAEAAAAGAAGVRG